MGELTPEQWHEIQQGLKQIIVLNTNLQSTTKLLEQTNKHIEEIDNKQNNLQLTVASLIQTIKGINGDKKVSILGRLDALEGIRLQNKNIMIKLIIAIISSGVTTSVGSIIITKLLGG